MAGATRIEPATAGDLADVAALVERAYSPWIERIGRRPGPMDDDYAARLAAGEVFALRADDRLAGLIVLRPAVDHLLVDNVAIEPDLQRRGYGRALLAFAEERAAALELPELRLHTHVRMRENIELYRRLGWQEYERGTGSGFPRVYFRKPLR